MTRDEKAKALTNPSSVFKRPEEVVACADLTEHEKAAVLKQWELDARLLQVATEEGMGDDGERPQFTAVKEAQKKLQGAPLKEGGPPSKVGP